VADRSPPELRKVFEFSNVQVRPAEVLAVELRQYQREGLRTPTPIMLGETQWRSFKSRDSRAPKGDANREGSDCLKSMLLREFLARPLLGRTMALIVRGGVDLKRRKPARKPGQRADLTIQDIVEAGFAVLKEHGLQDFSARLVAKKLGVSPGAIYAHLKGGLGELKARMVWATLAGAIRPYRRRDTPASYLRDLLLELLKAINGEQSLAQLIALELSADYLVCPIFIEGLLRAPVIGARGVTSPARRLDVAMTVILGMIMVEAETRREGISKSLSNALTRRVRAYPPDAAPKLLAHSTELALQIMRRLNPTEAHLRRTAARYAGALLAALAAEGSESHPGLLSSD
jgi:AcrR family transcriptional regulator